MSGSRHRGRADCFGAENPIQATDETNAGAVMHHRAVALLLILIPGPPVLAEAPADVDWPHYANDLGSSKYAPLDQIDSSNVAQLENVWIWRSPDDAIMANKHQMGALGYKNTPIKIGDVLYVSTSLGQVAALHADTGESIWVFDTGAWKTGRPTNLGFNTRGVAYWSDGKRRRVLMATNDAYLWSIDAATGKPDQAFGEDGRIDLTKGLGRWVSRKVYGVMSAPVIVRGVVVVGASIMDRPRDKESPPGHVRGFDVVTGERRWIFHSIPHKGEFGVETWEDESWKYSGNTNVWTLMSADPVLGYVYLPFGTPTNDYYGGHRLGDNLFAESLVCLDAETGKRVWHFQAVRHGLWDYDLPAAPTLVDINVDGKAIKAVAQVSKQAFVYVLDRVTGKPVWPIEDRKVPASDVPGERASTTQPFPTRPAPFDVQGVTDESLIDFTPELRKKAVEVLSVYRYGPLFTPPSLEGTIQLPGQAGAANWRGAAFDPETSLFYIPSITSHNVVKLIKREGSKMRYDVGRLGQVRGLGRLPFTKPPYSRISAIDLSTGEYRWVKPNGEGMRNELIELGIPDPGPVGARRTTGPLLTKSLLFVGLTDVSGPMMRALDKATGATVAEIALPYNPSGTPMTYMANGRQYIVVAGGTFKESRLMALGLPTPAE